MTSKTYKTLVGAFVIGGITLFVGGLILLGSGRIFTNALTYTLYFGGSVSGLSIGAPVVFRGVPMGSVTQIRLVANSRDSNITIPVTIRIEDQSFIMANGEFLNEHEQAQIIQRMVERGLRARLQMASFITGQYRVELDFFPNTPMNYRSKNPEWEIPTIPSPIDTLQKTLARLPLDQIADSLTTILSNLNEAVGGGQVKTAIEAVSGAFKEMQGFFANDTVRQSVENTLAQLSKTTGTLENGLAGALNSFQSAMDSLAKAANRIGQLSVAADDIIARDSPTMNDLRRLLKEAAAAARALRNFADMLERNPEALLRGRHGSR